MIGDLFEIDSDNSAVYAIVDGKKEIVKDVQGMKLEILKELGSAIQK